MAELLIRAGMNDHVVVNDLLAPMTGPRLLGRGWPLSRLVASAQLAQARPSLAQAAQGAGIPYLVDPETPFMQSGVAENDRWAQLRFAQAGPLTTDAVDISNVVEGVIEFELESGATTLIPPYFYAQSSADPWFELSLRSLELTADYIARHDLKLPVLPVMCAQLQSFANHVGWPNGVDRLTQRARALGYSTLALCLSPAGGQGDTYGKVRRLFDTARRATATGLRVFAWRQGIYGPGLVAAGLDGYECGMGTGEQTNVARQQSSRRPGLQDREPGGAGSGIFIETLGRSVSRGVATLLLNDAAMSPKVMCDDEACCASIAATLRHPREHAIRTRSRLLAAIAGQPASRWRLSHIAREAAQAATLAAQVNRVLAAQGNEEKLDPRSLEALATVADELAEGETPRRSA
jgi:hypothetical protein